MIVECYETCIMCARTVFIAFLFLTAHTALAQMSTELKPETLHAFKRYVAKVESGLEKRENGGKPFLWLDEHPNQRKKPSKARS